jgi:hypothetical protein
MIQLMPLLYPVLSVDIKIHMTGRTSVTHGSNSGCRQWGRQAELERRYGEGDGGGGEEGTPGHPHFGGDVTKALRATDGRGEIQKCRAGHSVRWRAGRGDEEEEAEA